MKTITPAQKQALEDLSAEGLLRGLPVQTAEKDIHITDLLKSLSELKVYCPLCTTVRRQRLSRHLRALSQWHKNCWQCAERDYPMLQEKIARYLDHSGVMMPHLDCGFR